MASLSRNLPELGRYVTTRDRAVFDSLNAELMIDIIECFVQIFKISPYETKTNVYGEASPQTGKTFYPGVEVSALIEHPDTSTKEEGFGTDREKSITFKFHEGMCKLAEIYPEVGDVVAWDDQYFEISNVIQEQHLGGQFTKSHSIICNAHLTKLTTLNITERVK